MTTVVIADDQELVRQGIRWLLESRGIKVLAEATDGKEAVRATLDLQPDVLVLDIRMPLADGIDATRELRRVGDATRILVLTTYDLDELVHEALRAGADGFVLKAISPERLVEAIERVAAGEALLSPSITTRLIAHYARTSLPEERSSVLAPLTERERDVLKLIASGKSNTEIAHDLFIGSATVKTHINRVFTKLGLATRAQAVITAYESGLVQPGGVEASHTGSTQSPNG